MTVLNEKAALIGVTASTWIATKKSREGTNGTADLFATSARWVMTSTRLVEKSVIQEPKKIIAAARHYLAGKSVGPADGKWLSGGLSPWDGRGRHILPNVLNEQVTRNLGEFQSQFTDAVDRLRAALPTAIDKARAENPKLFNASDYGTIENIIARFSFEIERDLIPDAGDLRVEASREYVDHLKSEIEGRSTRKLEEVTSNVIATVIEVCKHFADKCEGYDPEKRGSAPFRDATVNKVRDLINTIPALNINGDARIDKARQDLIAAVGNKSATQLREDDDVREDAAAKARAVADNISNLFD